MADWDWLDQNPQQVEALASITDESLASSYEPVAQPIIVRGQTVIVYDMELTLMLIKQWLEQGMTRTEIEDLMLEKIPE